MLTLRPFEPMAQFVDQSLRLLHLVDELEKEAEDGLEGGGGEVLHGGQTTQHVGEVVVDGAATCSGTLRRRGLGWETGWGDGGVGVGRLSHLSWRARRRIV